MELHVTEFFLEIRRAAVAAAAAAGTAALHSQLGGLDAGRFAGTPLWNSVGVGQRYPMAILLLMSSNRN